MNQKLSIIILLVIFLLILNGCIFKSECPHACCLEGKDYKIKVCADSSYSCKENQCVKCGNQVKEFGENCKTCPQDSPCANNQACSNFGECIQLGTNADCARIGDSCQPYEKCVNNLCEKRECPYECCDGSTYKLKLCESSFHKCDVEQRRCVNKIVSTAGKIGTEVKDSFDNVVNNLDKLKIW